MTGPTETDDQQGDFNYAVARLVRRASGLPSLRTLRPGNSEPKKVCWPDDDLGDLQGVLVAEPDRDSITFVLTIDAEATNEHNIARRIAERWQPHDGVKEVIDYRSGSRTYTFTLPVTL